MVTSKTIPFKKVISWSGIHILLLLIGTTIVSLLYEYDIVEVVLPWLPLSIIGTAVAFYLGFKNNQAYDRIWEARKVWGAIVNSSRTWGMDVDGFITNQPNSDQMSEEELSAIKKRLTYRHIAWLYMLRKQLLEPTSWEHANQKGLVARFVKNHQRKYGLGLVENEVTESDIDKFIPKNELDLIIKAKNPATQLIFEQSKDIAQLRKKGLINDFSHVELTTILKDFYTQQGKCERIKKFPIPRQMANMSRYFVGIFLILLPFSMIPEIVKSGHMGVWLAIPITSLVGWIYIIMEIIGDFAEFPFQGLGSDIPMLSICRTIEIDLKEMLSETDLPEPIKSKSNILM